MYVKVSGMFLKETEVCGNNVILKLTDGGEEEKVTLSADDFYAFRLHSGMEIDTERYREIKAAAEKTAVFAKCLHKLTAHDRSVREMKDWLSDNLKISDSLRDEMIQRLERLGWLDDERYCREQITAMKNSLKGEKLIRDTLLRKGISPRLIDDCLRTFDDEADNARRCAEKILRSRTGSSLRKTREEIRTKLMQRGYSVALAAETAEHLDYSGLAEKQDDNLRAGMRKTEKRLSRKYSGYELRSRLYRWGLQQGYAADVINAVLDEMESEYEED